VPYFDVVVSERASKLATWGISEACAASSAVGSYCYGGGARLAASREFWGCFFSCLPHKVDMRESRAQLHVWTDLGQN
jgi:hypothetical protein